MKTLSFEHLEGREMLSVDAFPSPSLLEGQAIIQSLEINESPAGQLVSLVEADIILYSDTNLSSLDLADGTKLAISEGVKLTVDEVSTTDFAWIRVGGTLEFARNIDTELRVVTMVVLPGGTLDMGTATSRIEANTKVVFLDRGPRDRVYDPMDLSGGLLAQSSDVSIFGKEKTGHLIPTHTYHRRDNYWLRFDEKPDGWDVGDTLLFPGDNLFQNEDELFKIERIWGRYVKLDGVPAYNHEVPGSQHFPVSNLTRNIVFESENLDDISRRAHMMFMAKTGVEIESIAVLGLGRTDGTRIVTDPMMVGGVLAPGSDDNTRGRYPIHFHKSDVDKTAVPHYLGDSVVVGSPKHGLVHHGSNVLVEGNVIYDIGAGSAFFTENGTELGFWKDNVAVRSKGLGGLSVAQKAVRSNAGDFGFEGYGFWFQGGGVEMINNAAFGNSANSRSAGFGIAGQAVREEGQIVHFPAKNLDNPALAKGKEFIHISSVPLHIDGFLAAGNWVGMDLAQHLYLSSHDGRSLVENVTLYRNSGTGIHNRYTHDVDYKNLVIIGTLGDEVLSAGTGLKNGTNAKDLTFDGVTITGYDTGFVKTQYQASETVDNAEFKENRIHLSLAGRPSTDISRAEPVMYFTNITFGHLAPEERLPSQKETYNLYLPSTVTASAYSTINPNYLHSLFDRDQGIWINGERVYFADQHPDFVPFPFAAGIIPDFLIGKTNRQIFQETGLAVHGALMPDDIVFDPLVLGGTLGPDLPSTYLNPPPPVAAKIITSETLPNHLNSVGMYIPEFTYPDGRTVTINPYKINYRATDIDTGFNFVVFKDNTTGQLVLDLFYYVE